MSQRFLGIEIGGTKLQVGVGEASGPPLLALRRTDVQPEKGAEGIRARIAELAAPLIAEYRPAAAGIAFGGPLDARAGRTLRSHHIAGWEDFPLADWCRETLGLPAVLGNDADLAGLAEARFGAGRGHQAVFFFTVGTGIGGALIYQGKIYGGSCGIAAELGHLRPGPGARDPGDDLESYSAGWGIAKNARTCVTTILAEGILAEDATSPEDAEAVLRWRQRLQWEDLPLPPEGTRAAVIRQGAQDLLQRADGDPARLSAKLVGEAARQGNPVAHCILRRATRTLGWAVAQMITLLAPSCVVVGGGVSLLGEELFFAPLRREVEQYVFPALRGTYRIVPAALGEEVMVHGAVALAADSVKSGIRPGRWNL
ncbi:MAG: ROK family protein [Thermogutta sp.]|nr:ROK family protein [Thermogutta sp.]